MALALGRAPEGPDDYQVTEGHFQACELTPMTEMIIVPDPGTEVSTALGTRQSLLQALSKCALEPGR